MKDNLFWKTVKPAFSSKGDHASNMQVVKGNILLKDDQIIIGKLNGFFKTEVSNLKINENMYIINHNSGNISAQLIKLLVSIKFHQKIKGFFVSTHLKV